MAVLTRAKLARELKRSLRTVRRLEQLGAIPAPEPDGTQARYEEAFAKEAEQWFKKELDRIVIIGKSVWFHWADGSVTHRPSMAKEAKRARK